MGWKHMHAVILRLCYKIEFVTTPILMTLIQTPFPSLTTNPSFQNYTLIRLSGSLRLAKQEVREVL